MKYNTLTLTEKLDTLERISECFYLDIINDNERDFASFSEFLDEHNAVFYVHNEFFLNTEKMHDSALKLIKVLNNTFTDTLFVCSYEFVNDSANECFMIYSIDDINR